MKASLGSVRLAHTRLSLGRSWRCRAGRSSPDEKRLSRTWAGVRTRGAWANTAATVAIFFFLLAFSPFLPHDPGGTLWLDHGDALAVDGAHEQSSASTPPAGRPA
jgi:hypothetical protein